MKKYFVVSLVIIIAFLVWQKLTNKSRLGNSLSSHEIANPESQNSNYGSPSSSFIAPLQKADNQQYGQINPLAATNLEQWKTIIPGLRKLSGFKISEYWAMDQTNRRTGVPVTMINNGQMLVYKVNLANISFTKGTNVMEVELHSPIMDINETRQLGSELCAILGADPRGFLLWCDQVGNNWKDEPSYTVGDQHLNFQTKPSFGEQTPWYINFIYTPNP
jgi:hypothetical protein